MSCHVLNRQEGGGEKGPEGEQWVRGRGFISPYSSYSGAVDQLERNPGNKYKVQTYSTGTAREHSADKLGQGTRSISPRKAAMGRYPEDVVSERKVGGWMDEVGAYVGRKDDDGWMTGWLAVMGGGGSNCLLSDVSG